MFPGHDKYCKETSFVFDLKLLHFQNRRKHQVGFEHHEIQLLLKLTLTLTLYASQTALCEFMGCKETVSVIDIHNTYCYTALQDIASKTDYFFFTSHFLDLI